MASGMLLSAILMITVPAHSDQRAKA